MVNCAIVCINLVLSTEDGEYTSKEVIALRYDDDELDNDKLSKKEEDANEKKGEKDMAVIEKELKKMQQLQQQKRKLTRDEIKKAMIKQTIHENYEALERLSRT